ncbi:MAG: 2OG-Fe(II) oxygenase [Myxococcales bacterium]|nr:2OG-Fe(II) oxygenase [Myxococcales bacterium]
MPSVLDPTLEGEEGLVQLRETRSLFASRSLATWESLPRASHQGGFFIPDLVDHHFGADWRTFVHDRPVDEANASAWWSAQLLDPAWVTQIRHHFLFEGPLLHVGLQDIFQQDLAWGLWEELSRAEFVRHHFPDYHIDIIPHEKLEQGSLLEHLVSWLRSREAAQAHHWLVGWPHPLPADPAVQVQISRLREGDFFAPHEDTGREGIAVVYNLSAHWDPSYGGTLYFPHPDGQRIALAIPPIFNSAIIFRPQGAPHWVDPVQQIPEGLARYTITCFYLVGDED